MLERCRSPCTGDEAVASAIQCEAPKPIRARRRAVRRRNIVVGRKINKSATRAAIIAKALSHPNSRNDGRLEKTVIASPQASTTDVRIRAGPTRTVARSIATAGSASGSSSSRTRLRKWIVALRPNPKDTVSATTLANCRPCPVMRSKTPEATIGKIPGRIADNITTTERKAKPRKMATPANSTVSPRFNFAIILALLRAAIAERPVTAIV